MEISQDRERLLGGSNTNRNNPNKLDNNRRESYSSSRDSSLEEIETPTITMVSKNELNTKQYKWRLGLILLSVVVFLWVASNFLVNVSIIFF